MSENIKFLLSDYYSKDMHLYSHVQFKFVAVYFVKANMGVEEQLYSSSVSSLNGCQLCPRSDKPLYLLKRMVSGPPTRFGLGEEEKNPCRECDRGSSIVHPMA